VTEAARRQRRWVAPVADLACIVAFILVGAGRHNIGEGAGWFFTVLWPLAAGWYVSASVTGLYRATDRWVLRLAGTIALGTLLGALLRGGFTDRPTFSIFTVIYITWMALTAFGWRASVSFITNRRRAASTADAG
jgi:Protein of unknown function (DUF3054)